MPETDLLDYACAEVFKSVATHYLNKETTVYKEGTAPPPSELGRCIDYYTAVHASHYSNFAVLKERVKVWLFRAVNDRDMGEASVGVTTTTSWIARHSASPLVVEPMLRKASRMAHAGETGWNEKVEA